MSLVRKLEGEVEIRESGGDVYHEIYKNKPHHVSHASPHFVEACDLHEGEFGQPGSIIVWKYKLGGKALRTKILVEEVDENKKLVKQKCIEGDMMDEYKTLSGVCQVIPKGDDVSIVRWTLEYEKLHPHIPEPSALLDSLLASAKEIDDHHHGVNAQTSL